MMDTKIITHASWAYEYYIGYPMIIKENEKIILEKKVSELRSILEWK